MPKLNNYRLVTGLRLMCTTIGQNFRLMPSGPQNFNVNMHFFI